MKPLPIVAFVDSICPWCFLGLRQLYAALNERPDFKFTMDYRPFFLNPNMPNGGMIYSDYYREKFGDEATIEGMRTTLTEAGAELGIAYNFDAIERTPNTLNAQRLIRWAALDGLAGKVLDDLFKAYFEEGRDIGDSAVLIAIARNAGMDAARVDEQLKTDSDVTAVQSAHLEAQDFNINGVPTFVFGGQIVLKGAHEKDALLELLDRISDAIAANTPNTA